MTRKRSFWARCLPRWIGDLPDSWEDFRMSNPVGPGATQGQPLTGAGQSQPPKRKPLTAARIRKIASAGALALFLSFGLASLDAAGIKGLSFAYVCIGAMCLVGIIGVVVAESIAVLRSELRRL